jgi:molecular chaperone GrpE (heat shock protein)
MILSPEIHEYLARQWYAKRMEFESYPQSWKETREDNRQFARDAVITEWLPLIEIYEEAKTLSTVQEGEK